MESFFLWWKPSVVCLRRYRCPDCRSTLVCRCPPPEVSVEDSLEATVDMTEASRFDEDWLEVRLGSIWNKMDVLISCITQL